MPVRPILRYPDPRLSTPAARVDEFDTILRQLADDLLDTMRAAPGVGITAPHIGVMRRISVIQLAPDAPVLVHVNPEIIAASGPEQRFTEGSVSMPGFTEEVERPGHIRFRHQDLDGTWHEGEADGFLSTCIQHEIDQLDGIFWTRRLSRLKRDRLLRKYEKSSR
ncbi:peptide deformylase [Rhizobium sp. RU35A]|uniref:peptide deformylase n=1 Tax=Rhizobium sp. RU35A TaxID=1907414 RepID=UPI00095429AB|nr:peptide deformylase [Rhizobium sp. RU35A]SIQ76823.1 peptide deformylase [Rhizobium sp. RU35A]